jgi:ribosomal protein L37AE/L43A
LSAKHQKEINGSEIKQKLSNIKQQLKFTFCCENCDKKYQTQGGLWKHKKKCISTNDTDTDNNNKEITELKELMKYLMKENSELKTMMFEVIKNGTHNNTNNSHNKSFNLQFFLNETCKDAMNIMDFVDSIKIQLSDLEKFGEIGYVDGISKIIMNNLNSLDETKRPVHCTDTKREVMYVKDEDKWEKEADNKPKIRKLIKHVTHKNTKLLKDFKTKYPGCEKSDSQYSNKYDKLIIEAFGGKGDDDLVKENKIIKNILKEVTIEKE